MRTAVPSQHGVNTGHARDTLQWARRLELPMEFFMHTARSSHGSIVRI